MTRVVPHCPTVHEEAHRQTFQFQNVRSQFLGNHKPLGAAPGGSAALRWSSASPTLVCTCSAQPTIIAGCPVCSAPPFSSSPPSSCSPLRVTGNPWPVHLPSWEPLSYVAHGH